MMLCHEPIRVSYTQCPSDAAERRTLATKGRSQSPCTAMTMVDWQRRTLQRGYTTMHDKRQWCTIVPKLWN